MGGGIAQGAKGFKFGFGRFVRVMEGGFEGIKNRPPGEMDLLKN